MERGKLPEIPVPAWPQTATARLTNHPLSNREFLEVPLSLVHGDAGSVQLPLADRVLSNPPWGGAVRVLGQLTPSSLATTLFRHLMPDGRAVLLAAKELNLPLLCFEQIKGFGEYGFPESHVASFALLVYVSSWIKCHFPDVFCAALLNSQPMGFYAPAQIVRDARHHGIEVRQPVNYSDWDTTLEPTGAGRFAVRLGLRQIEGLPQGGGTADHGASRPALQQPPGLAEARRAGGGGHPPAGGGRCLPVAPRRPKAGAGKPGR